MSSSHKGTDGSQSAVRPTALMIGSIVCSVVALGLLPPLFGGLAIFLGYKAYQRDAGVGQVCMTIGGIALIVGFIVGAWFGAENLRF